MTWCDTVWSGNHYHSFFIIFVTITYISLHLTGKTRVVNNMTRSVNALKVITSLLQPGSAGIYWPLFCHISHASRLYTLLAYLFFLFFFFFLLLLFWWMRLLAFHCHTLNLNFDALDRYVVDRSLVTLPYLIIPHLIPSYLILSYLTSSYPTIPIIITVPCQILLCPVLSCPALPCRPLQWPLIPIFTSIPLSNSGKITLFTSIMEKKSPNKQWK